MLIKKPIHLFLTLDILVLRGYDLSLTKERLYEDKTLILLNIITLIYCIIECSYAFIMIHWISLYGVEAFHLDIILDNILNIVMTGISIVSFIFINNRMDVIVSNKTRTRKIDPTRLAGIRFHSKEAIFIFAIINEILKKSHKSDLWDF